jgi:hypothetical protein
MDVDLTFSHMEQKQDVDAISMLGGQEAVCRLCRTGPSVDAFIIAKNY